MPTARLSVLRPTRTGRRCKPPAATLPAAIAPSAPAERSAPNDGFLYQRPDRPSGIGDRLWPRRSYARARTLDALRRDFGIAACRQFESLDDGEIGGYRVRNRHWGGRTFTAFNEFV